MNTPLDKLRYHVTGAIERGEKEAITEQHRMKEQHTPTPWYVHKVGFDTADIGSKEANALTCTAFGHGAEQTEANAAFIVRACNGFEAYENALREIARTDRTTKVSAADLADIARAALSSAKD